MGPGGSMRSYNFTAILPLFIILSAAFLLPTSPCLFEVGFVLNGEDSRVLYLSDLAPVRDLVRSMVQYFNLQSPSCTVPMDYECVVEIILPLISQNLVKATKEHAFYEEAIQTIQARTSTRGSPSESDEEAPFLHPDIDTLLLNIGSHTNPSIPELFRELEGPAAAAGAPPPPPPPPRTYVYLGNRVATLAFEPRLEAAAAVQPAPYLHVVAAAVAGGGGGGGGGAAGALLRPFYFWNAGGVSSSLGRAAAVPWEASAADGGARLVPVIPLQAVFDAIPGRIEIALLKTDMQGADFEAVRGAAPAAVRRARFLLTEVWLHHRRSYEGMVNDLCRDWVPLMAELGYRPVAAQSDFDPDFATQYGADPASWCAQDVAANPLPQVGAAAEADVLWARGDVDLRGGGGASARPPASTFAVEPCLQTESWFPHALQPTTLKKEGGPMLAAHQQIMMPENTHISNNNHHHKKQQGLEL